MDLKTNLGKRIQKIRHDRGLTQEKLAELIDKTPASVAKIEGGQRFPKAETIELIIKALQVSYADLFNFDKEPVINKNDNILYELSTLNPAGKEIIYKIITKVIKGMDEFKK